MCASLNSVFASARDDLRNVVAALETDTPQGQRLMVGPEQWNQFWATFEGYAASLSQACHILAISFRSLRLPSPADTADMTAKLQGSAVGVLQALAALSPRQGPRFVKHIRSAGLDIVGAGLTFLEAAFCRLVFCALGKKT